MKVPNRFVVPLTLCLSTLPLKQVRQVRSGGRGIGSDFENGYLPKRGCCNDVPPEGMHLDPLRAGLLKASGNYLAAATSGLADATALPAARQPKQTSVSPHY
jgi:hypothetical protein